MPKTPSKGVHMSGEDRDLQAMRDRRAAPVETFDDVTKPHDLIDIDSDRYKSDVRYREELNAVNQRYQSDPAFRAMWNIMRRQRRESNRTLGTVADAASEVHHDVAQLRELGESLGDLKQWQSRVDAMLGLTKWVLGFVLAASLGSIIVIATKIYTWGVSSGELEIRLQHIEKTLERRARATNDTIDYAPATTTRTP
jgi:hypothetical protein